MARSFAVLAILLTILVAMALEVSAHEVDPPSPGLFWVRFKRASKMRRFKTLGALCVKTYNEWHRTTVKFQKVMEGQEQLLLGGAANYRLVVRAKEGSMQRYYDCRIALNTMVPSLSLPIINPIFP